MNLKSRIAQVAVMVIVTTTAVGARVTLAQEMPADYKAVLQTLRSR